MTKRNQDRDSMLESRSPLLKPTALAAAVAAALAAFAAPSIVQAQGATATGAPLALEEIVVTAQRRSQNLQDVPISVSAFSQQKMDVQGIRDIADIAKFTPSLSFSGAAGMKPLATSISIRGVSSGVGGATTGVYINDTPVQVRSIIASGNFASTAYPQLFDIERVEVLRGPQGTLFGSGSEGGTVRFITPEPSLTDTSVYVRTGASSTKYGSPSYEFGIAGGTPIIENKLGLRASYSFRNNGGYVDHGNYYNGWIDQEDYNHQQYWSTRIALKWAVNDRLTITPSYFHQVINATGGGGFYLPDDTTDIDTSSPSYIANHSDPRFKNFGHFGEGVSNGHYVNGSQVVPTTTQEMDIYAAKAEYALDKINIIYDISLYKRQQHGHADFGFLDFGLWTGGAVLFPSDPSATARSNDSQDNRFFTQELRFQNADTGGRFNWVVGLFSSQQDIIANRHVYDPMWASVIIPTFGIPCTGMAACNAIANSIGFGSYKDAYPFWGDTTGDNDERAIYGQVDINATDHLVVTLGARYSDMSFNFKNEAAGGVNGPAFTVQKASSSTDATTPKLGLKWTTDGGKMFYFTAAKGTRNGGANPPVQSNPVCNEALQQNWNLTEVPKTYGPDSVWSYELGTKFRTLQQKLTVDADIYQINWSDIIRNVDLGKNDAGQSCPLSYTTNLGDARARGAELSMQYYPVDSLMLSANIGYAKVQSANTIYVPDASDPTGHKHQLNDQGESVPVYITRDGAILGGSHTTASLAAQYSFSAFDKQSYFRVDWQWSGTPEKGDAWDPANAGYAGANMLFETPDVKVTNVRLGTHIDDWDVSVFVNNLANNQPIFKFRQQSNLAFMNGSTIMPRQIGFTAIFRY